MEQLKLFIGNHPLITMALIGVPLFWIISEIQRKSRKFDDVDPVQMTAIMNRENALVLDVREKNEYQSGHIIHAKHIPLSSLNDKIAEIEDFKDKAVVVYCRSGGRSAQACMTLNKQGFQTIYNLSGGIMSWKSANMPVEK